jgi:hypothetical protein
MNVKTRIYTSRRAEELEKSINAFLDELPANTTLIDIKYGFTTITIGSTYSAMIIYQEASS